MIRRAKTGLRPAALRTKSILCLAFSIVYFFSNVAAVHAAEAGFWAERRKAAQTMKDKPGLADALPGLGDADAPAKTGLTQEQYQLLAQLPRATDFDFGVAENVSITEGMRAAAAAGAASSAKAAPESRGAAFKDSPAWLTSLILPYGSIRDIHLARNPGAPLVIHIQDAHEINDAQQNMAALIQGLREERGINLVGLEGAQGAFALEPYRAYENAGLTKSVADHFVKEGYIGGPELAAITAPEPPLLWGVEDLALYESNIGSFRDSVAYKPAVHKFLGELRAEIGKLKARVYSEKLKEFDRHFHAYKNRSEGLGVYVRYLMSVPGGAQEGGYTNLHLLADALEWEESLDFRKVEKERLALVELFAKELSDDKLSLLVQQSLLYRLGRMSYGDYHRFLRRLCRDNGIDLDRFGQLSSYITYVLIAEQINRNELLAELTRLEERTQALLAVTPEQKRLVAAGRAQLALEKLTDHRMTQADWFYYYVNKKSVLDLPVEVRTMAAALGDPAKFETPAGFAGMIEPFEKFCEYAMQRNGSLVENLLAKMKAENATRAVLVAGGFHTDGLTQILREKEVSYVVVTPKINEVPKDNKYLDVFAHDPVPLERLFAGEVIYLVSHRLGAVSSDGEFRKYLFDALYRTFQTMLGNAADQPGFRTIARFETKPVVGGAGEKGPYSVTQVEVEQAGSGRRAAFTAAILEKVAEADAEAFLEDRGQFDPADDRVIHKAVIGNRTIVIYQRHWKVERWFHELGVREFGENLALALAEAPGAPVETAEAEVAASKTATPAAARAANILWALGGFWRSDFYTKWIAPVLETVPFFTLPFALLGLAPEALLAVPALSTGLLSFYAAAFLAAVPLWALFVGAHSFVRWFKGEGTLRALFAEDVRTRGPPAAKLFALFALALPFGLLTASAVAALAHVRVNVAALREGRLPLSLAGTEGPFVRDLKARLFATPASGQALGRGISDAVRALVEAAAKEAEAEILRERRLSRADVGYAVLLTGSAARGEATFSSDVDFWVAHDGRAASADFAKALWTRLKEKVARAGFGPGDQPVFNLAEDADAYYAGRNTELKMGFLDLIPVSGDAALLEKFLGFRDRVIADETFKKEMPGKILEAIAGAFVSNTKDLMRPVQRFLWLQRALHGIKDPRTPFELIEELRAKGVLNAAEAADLSAAYDKLLAARITRNQNVAEMRAIKDLTSALLKRQAVLGAEGSAALARLLERYRGGNQARRTPSALLEPLFFKDGLTDAERDAKQDLEILIAAMRRGNLPSASLEKIAEEFGVAAPAATVERAGERTGRGPASIFFERYKRGLAEKPATTAGRVLAWMGDPVRGAPTWETVVFPLAGTALSTVFGLLGLDPALGMWLGAGWATIAFTAFHFGQVTARLREEGRLTFRDYASALTQLLYQSFIYLAPFLIVTALAPFFASEVFNVLGYAAASIGAAGLHRRDNAEVLEAMQLVSLAESLGVEPDARIRASARGVVASLLPEKPAVPPMTVEQLLQAITDGTLTTEQAAAHAQLLLEAGRTDEAVRERIRTWTQERMRRFLSSQEADFERLLRPSQIRTLQDHSIFPDAVPSALNSEILLRTNIRRERLDLRNILAGARETIFPARPRAPPVTASSPSELGVTFPDAADVMAGFVARQTVDPAFLKGESDGGFEEDTTLGLELEALVKDQFGFWGVKDASGRPFTADGARGANGAVEQNFKRADRDGYIAELRKALARLNELLEGNPDVVPGTRWGLSEDGINQFEIQTPAFYSTRGGLTQLKAQLDYLQTHFFPGGFYSMHQNIGRKSLTDRNRHLDINAYRLSSVLLVFQAMVRALAGYRYDAVQGTYVRPPRINENVPGHAGIEDLKDQMRGHSIMVNQAEFSMHTPRPTLESKIGTKMLKAIRGENGPRRLELSSFEEDIWWLFRLLDVVAEKQEKLPLAVLGVPTISGDKPTEAQVRHFVRLFYGEDARGAEIAAAIFDALQGAAPGATASHRAAENARVKRAYEAYGLGVVYALHAGYNSGLDLVHPDVVGALLEDRALLRRLAADLVRVGTTPDQAMSYFPRDRADFEAALREAMAEVPVPETIVEPEVPEDLAGLFQRVPPIDMFRSMFRGNEDALPGKLRSLLDREPQARATIRRSDINYLADFHDAFRASPQIDAAEMRRVILRYEREIPRFDARRMSDLLSSNRRLFEERLEMPRELDFSRLDNIRLEPIRFTQYRPLRLLNFLRAAFYSKRMPFGKTGFVAWLGGTLLSGGLFALGLLNADQLLTGGLISAAIGGALAVAALVYRFAVIEKLQDPGLPRNAAAVEAGARAFMAAAGWPAASVTAVESIVHVASSADLPAVDAAAIQAFDDKGLWLDPAFGILYVQAGRAGWVDSGYAGNALYTADGERLYVRSSAASAGAFRFGSVLAHERGKRFFMSHPAFFGSGRRMAELVGNSFEFLFVVTYWIGRGTGLRGLPGRALGAAARTLGPLSARLLLPLLALVPGLWSPVWRTQTLGGKMGARVVSTLLAGAGILSLGWISITGVLTPAPWLPIAGLYGIFSVVKSRLSEIRAAFRRYVMARAEAVDLDEVVGVGLIFAIPIGLVGAMVSMGARSQLLFLLTMVTSLIGAGIAVTRPLWRSKETSMPRAGLNFFRVARLAVIGFVSFMSWGPDGPDFKMFTGLVALGALFLGWLVGAIAAYFNRVVAQGRAEEAAKAPPADSSSTADVLAPVKGLDGWRNGPWPLRSLYYLFAGAWETAAFRVLGLTALPALLASFGVPAALALGAGLLWSGPLFVLAHPLAARLAGRTDARVNWPSLIVGAVLFNAVYLLAAGLFPDAGWVAAAATALFHGAWDLAMNGLDRRRARREAALRGEEQLRADQAAESNLRLLTAELDGKREAAERLAAEEKTRAPRREDAFRNVDPVGTETIRGSADYRERLAALEFTDEQRAALAAYLGPRTLELFGAVLRALEEDEAIAAILAGTEGPLGLKQAVLLRALAASKGRRDDLSTPLDALARDAAAEVLAFARELAADEELYLPVGTVGTETEVMKVFSRQATEAMRRKADGHPYSARFVELVYRQLLGLPTDAAELEAIEFSVYPSRSPRVQSEIINALVDLDFVVAESAWSSLHINALAPNSWGMHRWVKGMSRFIEFGKMVFWTSPARVRYFMTKKTIDAGAWGMQPGYEPVGMKHTFWKQDGTLAPGVNRIEYRGGEVSAGRFYAEAIRFTHLMHALMVRVGGLDPDGPLTRADARAVRLLRLYVDVLHELGRSDPELWKGAWTRTPNSAGGFDEYYSDWWHGFSGPKLADRVQNAQRSEFARDLAVLLLRSLESGAPAEDKLAGWRAERRALLGAEDLDPALLESVVEDGLIGAVEKLLTSRETAETAPAAEKARAAEDLKALAGVVDDVIGPDRSVTARAAERVDALAPSFDDASAHGDAARQRLERARAALEEKAARGENLTQQDIFAAHEALSLSGAEIEVTPEMAAAFGNGLIPGEMVNANMLEDWKEGRSPTPYRRSVHEGIRGIRAPAPENIPAIVGAILSMMNEELKGIRSEGDLDARRDRAAALAARVHYLFVLAHPFSDGNGRLARLLVGYVFARSGVPAPAAGDRAGYDEAIAADNAEALRGAPEAEGWRDLRGYGAEDFMRLPVPMRFKEFLLGETAAPEAVPLRFIERAALFGQAFIERAWKPVVTEYLGQTGGQVESVLLNILRARGWDVLADSLEAASGLDDLMLKLLNASTAYEAALFLYNRVGFDTASGPFFDQLKEGTDFIEERLGVSISIKPLAGAPLKDAESGLMMSFAKDGRGGLVLFVHADVERILKEQADAEKVEFRSVLLRALLHEVLEANGMTHAEVEALGFRAGGLKNIPRLLNAYRRKMGPKERTHGVSKMLESMGVPETAAQAVETEEAPVSADASEFAGWLGGMADMGARMMRAGKGDVKPDESLEDLRAGLDAIRSLAESDVADESVDAQIARARSVDAELARFEKVVRAWRNSGREPRGGLDLVVRELNDFLIPRRMLVNLSFGTFYEKRAFVLFRMSRASETKLTDQGAVDVHFVDQVTDFGDDRPRTGLGWSPILESYVAVFEGLIERTNDEARQVMAFDLPSDEKVRGMDDPQEWENHRMRKLMQESLRRGMGALSDAQWGALRTATLLSHEVEHERRMRMLDYPEGSDISVPLEETLAELRSMIDAGPFHPLSELLASTLQGLVHHGWEVFGRLTGHPAADRAAILDGLEAYLRLPPDKARAQAAAAYARTEKEWAERYAERLKVYVQPTFTPAEETSPLPRNNLRRALGELLLGGRARPLKMEEILLSLEGASARALSERGRAESVRARAEAAFRAAAEQGLDADARLAELTLDRRARTWRRSWTSDALAGVLAARVERAASRKDLPAAAADIYALAALAQVMNVSLVELWGLQEAFGLGQGASAAEKREADLELAAALTWRLAQKAGVSGKDAAAVLEGLILRGAGAYNDFLRRASGVRPAGQGISRSAREVRDNTVVGHVLQVTPGMVTGEREFGYGDERSTAFAEVRGLARQLMTAAPEEIGAMNRVLIAVKGDFTRSEAVNGLIRNAGLTAEEGAALRAAFDAGRVDVLAAPNGSEFVNARGQFLASRIKAAMKVNSLTVLALQSRDWDADDLKSAAVTLLLMLEGNIVTDATKRIDSEIEQISFVNIQA